MRIFKKIIPLIIFTFLLITAASAKETVFTYYLDKETGTLCISGIATESAPETVEIPSQINGVAVTKIENTVVVNVHGDVKFENFHLKGAKHLIIPDSVNDINLSFYGTENLETVRLPKGVKVLPSFCFAGAKKLYKINLEYVEAISSFSFEGCTSLREVNLLNAKRVGTKAFNSTENLTIYGMKESAAQKYAEANDISFEPVSGFEKKALALYNLGLMKGTGITEYGRVLFDLERTPTRAECAVMLVRFLGKESEALKNSYSHPFVDVPSWADAYVAYAFEHGLTKGVSDTLFGSDTLATPEMYLTFMLRVLGYTDGKDFKYEDPWLFANEKGLTPRFMNCEPFYRKEMVDMSYLALFAKLSSSDTKLCDRMILEGIFTREKFSLYTEGLDD